MTSRKVAGSGTYRKWLPRAVQRVCYGNGWKMSLRRRIRSKTPAARSIYATSLRGVSDHFEANHCHIQNMRKCLALAFVRKQSEYVLGLPSAAVGVLEIAFDETEMHVKIGPAIGVHHIMMLHSRLWQASPNIPDIHRHELIQVPVFLQDTSAKTLANAILLRLPAPLDALKQSYGVLAVVLNSDSAAACKKVARHFKCLATLARIEVAPS
eukprot:6537317-Alexandrium_andersonii.AAC.1